MLISVLFKINLFWEKTEFFICSLFFPSCTCNITNLLTGPSGNQYVIPRQSMFPKAFNKWQLNVNNICTIKNTAVILMKKSCPFRAFSLHIPKFVRLFYLLIIQRIRSLVKSKFSAHFGSFLVHRMNLILL